MASSKDPLTRLGRSGHFRMSSCKGKETVRVYSGAHREDFICLSKKEIFEFAENIKDWCKDMVDPPEEKEEEPIKSTHTLALIWNTIESIKTRMEMLEDNTKNLSQALAARILRELK